MKKLNNIILAFAIILALLVGVSSIAPVFASSHDITIQLDSSKIPNKSDLKGRVFRVWKIDNSKIKDDLQTKAKEFEVYTVGDLDKKYPYPQPFNTPESDENGTILLKGLSDGSYYVREVTPRGTFISSFFILLPSNEKVIHPKLSITSKTNRVTTKKGSIKFKKISKKENSIGLKGAVFKVSKKEGEYYEDIIRDGKTYIVESDKDGYFEVVDLEYGKYFLTEITPPKGYITLDKPIEFKIDKNSKDLLVSINNNPNKIIITNKKETNHKNINKGYIPKTGDITLAIMILGGMLLFYMGYRMTREE